MKGCLNAEVYLLGKKYITYAIDPGAAFTNT